MARGNKYTCATCGKVYDFCPKCEIIKPEYEAERFCSAEHADIFAILSKHGCNLATKEETLESLKGYDTTDLSESVQKHIDSLKTETNKEVEVAPKKFSFRTQE